MADERIFERRHFDGVPSAVLSAERKALLASLEQPVEAPIDQEDRHGRLDSALASAREQFERKVADLSDLAATSGQLAPDDLKGLADLWLVVRQPELAQTLHTIIDKRTQEAGRSIEETAADPDAVRWDIAAHEAELVLRVAEEQLAAANEKLAPDFAERLVEQVFARYGSNL